MRYLHSFVRWIPCCALLFALGITEGVVAADRVSNLVCANTEDGNLLSWENEGSFTGITVLRDGLTVASLAATATSFLDADFPQGELIYSVYSDSAADQHREKCLLPVISVVFKAGEGAGWPGDHVSIPISLQCGIDILGFSFGLAYDPDELDLQSLDEYPGAAAQLGIDEIPFVAKSINPDAPEGEAGLYAAMLFDLIGDDHLPANEELHIFTATYEVLQEGPGKAHLTFVNYLGNPKVHCLAVTGAYPEVDLPMSDQESGTIVFSNPNFIRGDANEDGNVTLNDVIQILNYAAFGGELRCKRAADFDDNGSISIADPIRFLSHMYLGAVAPSAPFPTCGKVSGGSRLQCEQFDVCN